MGFMEEIFMAALEGKGFLPNKRKSKRFKNWHATLDLKTCMNCREKCRKLFEFSSTL